MTKRSIVFLFLTCFFLEAHAIKAWNKPLKRTPSPIYWLIEKYGFDVDRFMKNRSVSPLYFKNCQLIVDDKHVRAYSNVGIGTCLYMGLKYKQFDSEKRNNSYIKATLYLKESQKEVEAIVHWTPPKFWKSIGTVLDDIILHQITIELAEPAHYEEIYPVGIAIGIDGKFVNETIGQIYIQKLELKSLKSEADPDFKVLVLTAYESLEADELILSGIMHTTYTAFDEEFYYKLMKGKLFWEQ